jgi:hypothetical protein
MQIRVLLSPSAAKSLLDMGSRKVADRGPPGACRKEILDNMMDETKTSRKAHQAPMSRSRRGNNEPAGDHACVGHIDTSSPTVSQALATKLTETNLMLAQSAATPSSFAILSILGDSERCAKRMRLAELSVMFFTMHSVAEGELHVNTAPPMKSAAPASRAPPRPRTALEAK